MLLRPRLLIYGEDFAAGSNKSKGIDGGDVLLSIKARCPGPSILLPIELPHHGVGR